MHRLCICGYKCITKSKFVLPAPQSTLSLEIQVHHRKVGLFGFRDDKLKLNSRNIRLTAQSYTIWCCICLFKTITRSYQDHVTSGDVHVGRDGLLAPGGGAAARRRAGDGAIAELRGHAVEAWVTQGLRAVNALRCSDCHTLATQLLWISQYVIVKVVFLFYLTVHAFMNFMFLLKHKTIFYLL